MRGRGRGPAFSGKGGGGKITSLGPRDGRGGYRGGRGGRGSGRGRGRYNNGNYFGAKGEQGAGGGGGGGAGGSGAAPPSKAAAEAETAALTEAEENVLEGKLGFEQFTDGEDRLGWLINFCQSSRNDKEVGHVVSAINCYFMCQDGSAFKAQLDFAPYFFLQVKAGIEMEVDSLLRRKYENNIKSIEVVHKEDLDLKNHLSGLQRKLLKLTFWNVQQLSEVRRDMFPIVRRNKAKAASTAAYDISSAERSTSTRIQDAMDGIEDLREHDVPYHVRFAIDSDVRCGHWFTVKAKGGHVSISHRPDLLRWAEPRICAFDIETTKQPLQFPNAEFDQVFMISYMLDRQGYLIVNREVVGEDIHDFEYTPKPEFEGPFIVWNEPNEAALLRRWFDHMREAKPALYVTYNGDWFDWPFIETRAGKNSMDMFAEIGFRMDRKSNECLSKFAVHMDCLCWVNRDSYLPQGSRGLKAVTKAKLGYDPIEVDPEDMLRFAAEQPQTMASYSVSDAVSTYYLYMTYIHPFVFSLATIIPMPPDEVLRKGSGTLCEMLLMVQASKASVVAPNKHVTAIETMHKGHLLESETYIGGKVEALESGVFRSDLPTRFKLQPAAYQALLDRLDADLEYAIVVEGKMAVADIENYTEVREDIAAALADLRDVPNREETPIIYHLDVAAMYPNIILTNRLQPSAIVGDEDCAACDFNRPGKTCLRKMEWVWRGETFAATASEYFAIKGQLQSERFPPAMPEGPPRYYLDLAPEERAKMLRDRLKKYCQKVYKRVLDKPVSETRSAGVCMRENDFYVGTVRSFRDRRYEYKGLNKKWKGKLDDAKAAGNPLAAQEAADMVVLYDSLQLAHKCILNSFYGYVMRKGARWYSMEMAGVVTNTGAQIIQRAARLVEAVGKPLELDTDGIWCCLPASFPENYKLHNRNGKELRISYPCVMLNVMVAQHNTNDQYQTLTDVATKTYATSSEMSIEFEVDGPYRAMILPASKEEGKLIKKRYAVFNPDGSLAELKGFELKRRGELKLIKVFQGEVFSQFLKGGSLEECYAAVAAVADRWLDLLDTQGVDLTNEELVSYISEATTMSKSIDEYEGRKSCAITTARRLGEFLGDARIRDKGLNCNYVIARRPDNLPTSERAIPVAIFSAEAPVARSYLRKWTGEVSGGAQPPDVRDIVDWDYYRERLGSAIQKIITIPAAMQRIRNPVPRVRHPDWLHKKVQEKDDRFQQRKVDAMFAAAASRRPEAAAQPTGGTLDAADMEDFGVPRPRGSSPVTGRATTRPADNDASAEQENAGDAANLPGPSHTASREEETTEPAGPAPDRRAEPREWLAHQKRKWQAGAAERKKRRLEAAKTAQRAAAEGAVLEQPQPGRGVGVFYRQQQAAASQAYWQIVQLAPTAAPGLFKVWALVGSQLYAVPLRVPRSFYVASLLPPERADELGLGLQVARAKRTLPHGASHPYLYQVTMDDGEFRRQAPELALRLAAAPVQGMYEERLPLEVEAALQLGCVIAVAPHARRRGLAETFLPSDLLAQTTTACSYLAGEGPSGLGALRHVTLFHSADTPRGRGVFALHMPVVNRCLLVVASPASGAAARDVTPAVAERAWREAQEAAGGGADASPAAGVAQLEFVVQYSRSVPLAAKVVQKALSQLRTSHRGPTVVVVQSHIASSRLAHDIPLLAEFPAVDAPHLPADCQYPALGWQQRAARVALHRVTAVAPWLQERVGMAAYAHLPLSNMAGDWVIATADALYARCLRDAGHLLWITDETLPDVGGAEEAADAEAGFALDQQQAVEVLAPGAYRSVCVRLEVHHLAVNAVMQAAALGELEGAAVMQDHFGTGPAFRVLTQLVTNWLQDAMTYSNVYADALLRNLYRWLCNPDSALHDPALRRAVQALMRKVLLQLVAEMRKLGATVVAADFSSLILATGKRSLTAAVGYTDYLLDALKKRELFSFLHLAPATFWHTLLFRDRYNYAGILAELPPALREQLTQAPGTLSQGLGEDGGEGELAGREDADLERPQFDHIWNIKEYLPHAVQDPFLALVTEFVLLPWREARRGLGAPGASQPVTSQAATEAREAEQLLAGFLQRQVAGHFTQKLLKVVADMHRFLGTADGDPTHEFPLLAGSHLSPEELGTPALAFVKAVCAVFALDGAVEDETAVLRRQLLRLTHTREFSPAAAFKEPCQSYVLRDLICSACNAGMDLDLCRDPDLQAHDWRCRACGEGYDLQAVEAQLLAVVRRRVRAYQLQDLTCTKCKQVSAGHLRRACGTCGAALICTVPAATFRRSLTVFRNVARYHGFELLLEATTWLLEA